MERLHGFEISGWGAGNEDRDAPGIEGEENKMTALKELKS